MKSRIILYTAALGLLFASCQKESEDLPANATTTAQDAARVIPTRAYQDFFTTTSTITPTQTGVFNPGEGNGNATHFGNALLCYNQEVIFVNNQPVGSVAAPVNQFFATKLAAAGVTNVPNTVSYVSYDLSGNSVWFTSTAGTTLTPVSATRVNFSAPMTIVGGTGRFANATGSVTLSGYFNPQSQNQAGEIRTTGTITY